MRILHVAINEADVETTIRDLEAAKQFTEYNSTDYLIDQIIKGLQK
jgi:hypothetical protein